ncbi:(+)-neomenthol dehydrogenase-like [Impatiens glandulifera]|uniref:(+)-neomenthol dehydrogenase-like n=1 Tax=Impatiens glandulifera TaxID=253017 RepID=UPI001FB166BF|nr:(+)-neomenthol dehydrogenase-like [Impatiens glandulifera]
MDAKTIMCAIVTGSNKGLGLEICRQLAVTSITVVMTARDEKRGLEALEKLKESVGDDVIDDIIFHRLDVADSSTIPPLVDFIKAKFGKLDILINNAGISGSNVDWEYMKDVVGKQGWTEDKSNVMATSHTYEMTEECLQVNYYGTKNMIKAFVPLLQQSHSPRVLNVTSSMGRLHYLPNEWARGVLKDVDKLTEERIDEVVKEFLKDYKDETMEAKGWPKILASYILSKAALNAYSRLVAKEFSDILVNCACPCFVKTNLNANSGAISVEEGAESLVRVALLSDGISGAFFYKAIVSSFE